MFRRLYRRTPEGERTPAEEPARPDPSAGLELSDEELEHVVGGLQRVWFEMPSEGPQANDPVSPEVRAPGAA